MTKVFYVNKVCELPFLQQMKVCFNALKLCYDVFNEQDGLYFAPTPSINPTPTPPLHF